MSNTNLAEVFHQEMVDGYHSMAKLGYRANYLLQMIQEHGGVDTARRLLHNQQLGSGLTKLWELKRLDLSVEALVLRQPMLLSLPMKNAT
jgi:hypothetical protein